MEKVVVVADSHIRDNDDNLVTFLKFLESLEQEPTPIKLILLGDIFDFYCDSRRKLSTPINLLIRALEKCAQKCEVIFVEGNHEFGIRLKNVSVFRRCYKLARGGKKFLFLHGDEFAAYKITFPFLRGILHSCLTASFLCHLLPSKLIWPIAVKISQKSRTSGKLNSDTINKRLIKLFIMRAESDIIIFAHSHKRSIVFRDGKLIVSIGAWYEDFHYAIIEDKKLFLTKWEEK